MGYTLLLENSLDLQDVLKGLHIRVSSDDIEVKYKSEYGRILESKFLGIYVYQIYDDYDFSAVIVPEELVKDFVSIDTIRKRYFDYSMFKDENTGYIIQEFQKMANEKLSLSIWRIDIPVVMIEDKRESLKTRRKKAETIHITSYIISKTRVPDHVLHLDIREMFKLCKTQLEPYYIITSLEATKRRDILVTVFENEASVIVGIRVTKIYNKKLYEIRGSYVCSDGYGKLLQEHTEELIRKDEKGVFSIPEIQKRSIYFELSSIPSSYGFWKHIGFEDTGETDKDENIIMRKRLYRENEDDKYLPYKKRVIRRINEPTVVEQLHSPPVEQHHHTSKSIRNKSNSMSVSRRSKAPTPQRSAVQ